MGGGRGRGKGLTSSEPDGFRDTHAVFNLAGGSERTTGSLSPLIFAALKNLQRSRGCAAKAHAHLDSHLSGDRLSSTFPHAYWPFVYFPGKNVHSVLGPILLWVFICFSVFRGLIDWNSHKSYLNKLCVYNIYTFLLLFALPRYCLDIFSQFTDCLAADHF